MLYANLAQFMIPEELDLTPNSVLRGCDEQSVRSLNGCRVTGRLLWLRGAGGWVDASAYMLLHMCLRGSHCVRIGRCMLAAPWHQLLAWVHPLNRIAHALHLHRSTPNDASIGLVACTDTILKSVPDVGTFRLALKAIKLWAERRWAALAKLAVRQLGAPK